MCDVLILIIFDNLIVVGCICLILVVIVGNVDVSSWGCELFCNEVFVDMFVYELLFWL